MDDELKDPPPSKKISWAGRILNHLATRWATPGAGRVGVCSPLVGLVAGLGAVAFLILLKGMIHLTFGVLLGFHTPPTGEEVHPASASVPRASTSAAQEEASASMVSETEHLGPYQPEGPSPWWLVLLIPTLGGLISGLIVFTWAPEAEGHGTDAMIRAFHRGGGQIRTRIPIIKAVASIITIGSGGSAGQEGPIAQIGAGFGSLLARMLRLTPNERRLMMLAGTAGGIGAIFRAPLGGALFAGEVLYMTTATEAAALLPCLGSSIVAYTVFALFITPTPVFMMPKVAFHGLRELPMFALLAVICAVVGWLYVRVFYGLRDRVFHPMPIPPHVKPAIGGLMLGLLALAYPQLMSGGYGWVQWGAIGLAPEMEGRPSGAPFADAAMPMRLLLVLALLKIFATGLTISSGGSGGVFGPSVFIGGMLGGAFGKVMEQLFPGLPIQPAAFALVGMGGFFAGVSKTPLTSIVMVSEMTGSYNLLVPLMLVCGLHMAMSRRWTLYEEQVPSPIDSPAHQGDFVIDVLERLRVKQISIRRQGLELIPEAMPFTQIVRKVANSTETLFPVVDAAGNLTGIFTLRDIRLALLGSDWGPLVLAADVATRPVLTVNPEDDLHTALKRLTKLNVDELPVVDPEAPTRLIGLLNRRDLVAAYTAQVEALRSSEPAAA